MAKWFPTKVPRQFNGRKDSLLTNSFKTTGYPYAKKNEFNINKKKASVGEDMEKLEPSCIIGKKVKWYSHFEN